MKYGLVLSLLIALPCWGQASMTGDAETKGPCSPAVTGSNNKFTITCQGISDKLGAQLTDLLNKIAKNQTDAEAVMTKLDGCLQGVKEVREQQLPWQLTEVQKLELKHLLSGVKAKVSINVIPTDRNASLLALDLISVLKDSGWDVGAGITSDFTLNPALVGVVLVVTHQDFPEAISLQSALGKIGIKAAGELDKDQKLAREKDRVVIAIGAKPPVAH